MKGQNWDWRTSWVIDCFVGHSESGLIGIQVEIGNSFWKIVIAGLSGFILQTAFRITGRGANSGKFVDNEPVNRVSILVDALQRVNKTGSDK